MAHRLLARRLLMLSAAATIAAGLSGCLVSGHSNSSVSGAYVGPSTFAQVEPGVTTEEWVLATFGRPTERTRLSDDTEVLKWAYTRRKSGRGSVFLLYGGSDSSESVGAAFVQLQDGKVIKAWRD